MTLFELARASYAQIDLKDIAHPHMEDLMEATNQSVFLGTRSNNHVTIIDTVDSDEALKISSPIGTRVPLLAGAIGKAFLACMDESQAVSIIRTRGLRKFTENSITDVDRYMAEVEKARASGYGTDDEEYIPGVRAVAAVIQGSGQQMSAIWVVGFTPSMSAEKIPAIGMETKRAVETISRRIDLRPLEG
jgi:DNA-binding IclR family transcriptional regulator